MVSLPPLSAPTSPSAPFIQPLTLKHGKKAWKNCAVIIAEKSDEDLKPYLGELLEWLQDMNWMGAFCILGRLRKYTGTDSLHNAIDVCVEKSKRLWRKGLEK